MPKKASDWLTDEEYEFIYSRSPRICVDLLLVKDGGIILSKRLIEPYKNLWHFPGGRIKHRESVHKAVERIAKAEIGITPKKKELIGYTDVIKDGKFVHSISLVFLIKSYSGKIRGSRQARDFETFKKVPKIMHPYQKSFLDKNWKTISEKIS